MMDLPNYSTWEKTDKKVFSEPHFGRTQSLDSYGKSKWGCSDGHGHYIAQHLNIFPDGKITTGRNLNSTPIGIRGWNTNAICIEIYGDFDKNKGITFPVMGSWNAHIGSMLYIDDLSLIYDK